MDFRQLTQSGNTAPGPKQHAAAPAPPPLNSRQSTDSGASGEGPANSLFRILNVAMLVGIAILVLAIAVVFNRGKGSDESGLIDKSKYQAVFLNNGQVYFGHVDELNGSYVTLSGIYYLTQGSTSGTDAQNSGDYTLVKLGCQQIHDPTDQMVVNREQVTFWENLQDSGQVVSKIKEFQKAHPKGPDCSQVSTQTQATSNAGAQGSNAQTQAGGSGSTTPGTGATGSSTGTSSGSGSTTKQ